MSMNNGGNRWISAKLYRNAEHKRTPCKCVRTCFSAICALAVFLSVCEMGAYAQSQTPVSYSKAQLTTAMAVKTANEKTLMATKGVRGVGVGEKNGSLAVLVLVDDASNVTNLPSTLNGMPVSVRVVGKIHALPCSGSSNPQIAYPLPVPLGVSGGNAIMFGGCCASGTIGFKVRDNNTGFVGWISNNHVVGHGDDGCPSTAPIGTPEYQPGSIDASPTCSSAQYIGTLNRVVPIVFGGADNSVDAGFVVSSDTAVSGNILNLGPQVDNVVAPFLGQVVRKNGRTSGCTEGTVTGVGLTIAVLYSESAPCATTCGTATFTNQVEFSPTAPSTTMAEAGDSGSPVIDAANNAVALLFAGDGIGDGFGNPMETVLTDLDVTLSSSTSTQCITRTSRFWFTHDIAADSNCVTLLKAIEANGGNLDLGFITLPTAYYTGSSLTSTDALIEALGIYWRSTSKTIDTNTGATVTGSSLCRARKLLAAELIAATANVSLFGTQPSNCATNFAVDLLAQARAVAAGEDVAACLAMRKLLQEFNSSGVTNDVPSGLYECNAARSGTLKKLSRDPTNKLDCPGKNDQCETAEAVVFPLKTKNLITTTMPFKRSVNTTKYALSSVGDVTSTNAASGHLVWYKIAPDVGSPGRWFTANTAGSNFDTMLSVWQGTCDSLSLIASNDNDPDTPGKLQSKVRFSTDGSNTYYIVVSSGSRGGYGNAKITVKSP